MTGGSWQVTGGRGRKLGRGAEEAAAGADGRGAGAAEGAVGGGVGFDFEFDKGFGADGKLEAAITAVNEGAGGDDAAAFFFDHTDGFIGGAAGGPDVFNDEDTLAGRKAEAAAEGEMAAGIALDEEGPWLSSTGAREQGAGDFVSDDDAAQGRGDDAVELEIVEFSGKGAGKLFSVARVLKDKGALDVSGAVQAGRKLEMAMANGVNRLEKANDLFGTHGNRRSLLGGWARCQGTAGLIECACDQRVPPTSNRPGPEPEECSNLPGQASKWNGHVVGHANAEILRPRPSRGLRMTKRAGPGKPGCARTAGQKTVKQNRLHRRFNDLKPNTGSIRKQSNLPGERTI